MSAIDELLKGTHDHSLLPGLVDVRKLVTQLTKHLKEFEGMKTSPFGGISTQIQMLSASQAAQYGLEVPQGYQVKVMPIRDPQGMPHLHVITPEGWEITDQEVYISPLGDRMTYAQYISSMGKGFYAETELGQLIQRMAIYEDMPVGEIMRAEQEQRDFFESILAEGRSPEIEGLLRQVFEVSDDELDEIFATAPTPQQAAQQAIEHTGMTEMEAMLESPSQYPPQVDLSELDWKDVMAGGIIKKLYEGDPGAGFLASSRYLHSGVGDIFRNMASVARRFAEDDFALTLERIGSWGAFGEAPSIDWHGKKGVWKALDPRYYTMFLPSITPYTLALMPLAFIGVPIAGALGLGTFGTLVVSSVIGGTASRVVESALEGGGGYEEALAMNKTEEEACDVFDEVFWKNLMLVGLDAAQVAIVLAKSLPGGRGNPFLSFGLRAGFEIITEGGEEGLQDVFIRQGLGQGVAFDYRMQEAIMAGGFMGGMFGGVGEVVRRIKSDTVNNLSPEQLKQFGKDVEGGLADGLTAEQAEAKAYDNLAGTAEGKAVISEVLHNVTQEEIRKEAERYSRERFNVPASADIKADAFASNWYKRTLKAFKGMPGFKKAIETMLGPREMTDLESKVTEDVVARNTVMYLEIQKRGRDVAAVEQWVLRAISSNPIKLFGFNSKAYSKMMQAKLLPEFAKDAAIVAEAGTLEHVFTHPEMYELSDTQIRYITKTHSMFTKILGLLKAEGIAPKHVTTGWYVHRVVTGQFTAEGEFMPMRGRPGVGGASLGAKMAAAKHRAFKSMAEGIAAGYAYSPNPEDSIMTAINDAYKGVADARFAIEIAEFGEKPAEILARDYPELQSRFNLTKHQLDRIRKLVGAIDLMKKGGKVTPAQMRVLIREFPEFSKELKRLSGDTAADIKKLKEYIGWLKSQRHLLTQELEKAKERPEFPADVKILEAFQVMHENDRIAFRNTLESQRVEITQVMQEQEGNPEIVALGQARLNEIEKMLRLLDKAQQGETLESPLAPAEPHFKEVWEVTMAQFVRQQTTVIQTYDLTAEHKQELIAALPDVYIQYVKDAVGQGMPVPAFALRDAGVEAAPEAPVIPEAPIAAEPGLHKDMFGYYTPVEPSGKGKVVEISLEEYQKLCQEWKDAGNPGTPLNVGVQPGIEGMAEARYFKRGDVFAEALEPELSPAERKARMVALLDRAEALKDRRTAEYERSRIERTLQMEKIRQGGMKMVTLPTGEAGALGYIMQPMFGGKLYHQDFIDAINKWFGHEKGHKGLKFTSDAAGILRITKAAFDISVMSIQGMPAFGFAHSMLLVNPGIGFRLMGAWYKAWGIAALSFFHEDFAAKQMAANEDNILQRIEMGGSAQSVDYFAALKDQGGLAGIGQKVLSWAPPGVGSSAFVRAETSFFIGSELVRDEFWKVMGPKAIANGQEFEVARFLDRMTGIIDTKAMGVPVTIRQLESSYAWFAPRYTRACSSVVADIFRGGLTGDMARKSLGGLIGAGMLYFTAITFARALLQGDSEDEAQRKVMEGLGVKEDPITHEVTWEPTSRLLSIKIGNYWFGFGSFWYGLVRLFDNVEDCVNSVGGREPIDLIKIMRYGGMNRNNPFIGWWYTRSSPLLGLIRDVGVPLAKSVVGGELERGRTYFGTPIETPWEYAFYVASKFVPIWIEQGLFPYFMADTKDYLPNISTEFEEPKGLARFLTPLMEFMGMRVNAEFEWTEFYDGAQDIISHLPREFLAKYYTEEELESVLAAQAEGTLGYKQLTKTAKQALLALYPELQGLYEDAVESSNIRDSDAWLARCERLQAERDARNEALTAANNALLSGEIDHREWKKRCERAYALYSKGYDDIKTNPAYKEVNEYFERMEGKRTDYGWRDDLALQEYEDIIYDESLEDPITGEYNFDERDRRMGLWIEKWGMTMYDKILVLKEAGRESSGIPDLNILKGKDGELLGREYWELPHKAIYKMDEDNKTDGDIPAEYLALWEQYQAIEDEDDREDFKDAHPELTQDFRAEYRAAHPEHDAMLKLWGYGGDLQTKEAYDICLKRALELGFSDEALLKMNLPPPPLAEDMFAYNEIEGATERKQFRLEHLAFDEWGQEAKGWTPIVDQNVMPAEISGFFDEYNKLAKGDARLVFRQENPDFEKWLVEKKGYTPIGDRGKTDEELERMPTAEEQQAQEQYAQEHFIHYAGIFIEEGKEKGWLEHLGIRQDITPEELSSEEFDKLVGLKGIEQWILIAKERGLLEKAGIAEDANVIDLTPDEIDRLSVVMSAMAPEPVASETATVLERPDLRGLVNAAESNYWGCVPASIYAILEFYGASPSIYDIYKALDPTYLPDSGGLAVSAGAIAPYFESIGFNADEGKLAYINPYAKVPTALTQTALQGFKDSIREGHPVIVTMVVEGQTHSHACVVYGFDDELELVYLVNGIPSDVVSYEDFLKRLTGKAVVATPK